MSTRRNKHARGKKQKGGQHREKIRIGQYLHEIVTISDDEGKVLKRFVQPLMIEFYLRDVVQVIVGAALLALPVSFTEEVWRLGEQLPAGNIIAIMFTSLFFVALFSYTNVFHGHIKTHRVEFVERVLLTYIIALAVVSFFMFLIDQAPFFDNWTLAIRRIIIVGLPAVMSGTLADSLK